MSNARFLILSNVVVLDFKFLLVFVLDVFVPHVHRCSDIQTMKY